VINDGGEQDPAGIEAGDLDVNGFPQADSEWATDDEDDELIQEHEDLHQAEVSTDWQHRNDVISPVPAASSDSSNQGNMTRVT
jgi:hypothetical protein